MKKQYIYVGFGVVVVCSLVAVVIIFIIGTKSNKSKLVIDNDAGGDDAMAIFLALLNEKHYDGPNLIGVTTVNGNTIEDNVFINNQKILKIARRQDVPIYRGSKSSIVTTPPATSYYGDDGLGDSGDVYTDLVPAKEDPAVAKLVELSKTYEGDLTVVSIGVLTNIALAIKADADFLKRLNHLYIGAGHIHSDMHPEAEFNARTDCEAYHIIAQHATPDKVTVFPFSQAQIYVNFTKDWRENVLGVIDTDIIKAQNKFEKISLNRSDSWQALDPATVALFLRPDLVDEYKYTKNDIIMCGENRGINTNTFCKKEEANMRLIYSVKTEEYRKFLLDLFSRSL